MRMLRSNNQQTNTIATRMVRYRAHTLQHMLMLRNADCLKAHDIEALKASLDKAYITLFNPATIRVDGEAFIQAARTNTLGQLPVSNSFKAAYAFMPEPQVHKKKNLVQSVLHKIKSAFKS